MDVLLHLTNLGISGYGDYISVWIALTLFVNNVEDSYSHVVGDLFKVHDILPLFSQVLYTNAI
tara:strand:- start:622 stop:810 length:189 start_codon:yes stop_codon:yes gene_type:complete